MATKRNWQQLLKKAGVTAGRSISPISDASLAAFEAARSIRLPQSYRTFCEVLGAGEFGKVFKIAAPGYAGSAKAYSLQDLDELAHEGLEYQEYSPNPEQHRRGLFFGTDIMRSYYFFDPSDVTDAKKHEYAVYVLFSDFQVQRIADSFWLFITEVCLGDKLHLVIDQVHSTEFMPAVT